MTDPIKQKATQLLEAGFGYWHIAQVLTRETGRTYTWVDIKNLCPEPSWASRINRSAA